MKCSSRLRRRYGHASVKFPMRDAAGVGARDTYHAAASSIGSSDEPEMREYGYLIGQSDIEPAIAKWEAAVEGQVGRKLRFTRWREWSSTGRWRYVSVNRSVDAVAVVEEGLYTGLVYTNRAAWGFAP